MGKHSKTFYVMLFCQFWWAVSFYGLWSILPVYFNRELAMSESLSFAVFGGFAALSAALLFVGGWLSDKILGAKRTLTYGFTFQSIGYFLVAWSALNGNAIALFGGLGSVVIGRAISNTSINTLLALSYEEGDSRVDGAFTYLYMLNNIGAFIGQMVAPIVSSSFSWTTAFALSGIGMAINVVGFLFMRRKLADVGTQADARPVSAGKLSAFMALTILVIAGAGYLLTNLTLAYVVLALAAIGIAYMLVKGMAGESRVQRTKMVVGTVLMVQALVFFVLYNQMPTSLNFFAINNIRPEVFGIAIDPVSFQAFNPFWVILLSPILAAIYSNLDARGKDMSMPAKFALGMLVCAAAFALTGSARFFADDTGMLSAFWIAGPHFLFAVGELLISALGLSVVAKLFPRRMMGFIYGAWYMTLALSSVGGSWVAGFSSAPAGEVTPLQSLHSYSDYFFMLAAVAAVVGLLMVIFAPKLTRMISGQQVDKSAGSQPVPA